jgi:excisionase family DNA binding protein
MSNGMASQPEWLTASEAAAYLRVKTRSLLLWVRQGKMQAYALSGTQRRIWRFRKADLDAALFAKPVLNSKPPAVLPERRLN